MKKTRQVEIWRFQLGWSEPVVVTGMPRDRERSAFWYLDEMWLERFGNERTIYLRVLVGPEFNQPSLSVLGRATQEEW